MERKYDVFISHSTSDKTWSRRFAESLQGRGLTVFFDEWEAAPGRSIEQTVRSALESSSSVVVLLDRFSTSSSWAAFEVGAALSTGKQIVEVADPGVSPSWLPRAREYHRIDMTTPDEAADKVAQVVGKRNA